jgi:luciferase family oxidoreductase group 1
VKLPISVLDLSPLTSGRTAHDALMCTLDLARHAEAIGARRYWVAEHHNAKGIACSSPEIVIGQIAAATKTLLVGSGGVMLPNQAPLKVAEQFRVLSAFFPGRIELGLGRAPGTDPRTARALRRVPAGHELPPPDAFPAEVDELIAYLDENEGPRGAFARTVVAIPAGVAAPDVFILGSSDFGGALAAKMGLGFAFAGQINPHDAATVMRAYRRDFKPSARRKEPHAILSVAAVATSTEEEAKRLEPAADLGMLRFAQGLRDLPYPSDEEARAHVLTDDDRALLTAFKANRILDPIDRAKQKLDALVDETQADELMVMTHVHDHEMRKRSYSLLVDAFSR